MLFYGNTNAPFVSDIKITYLLTYLFTSLGRGFRRPAPTIWNLLSGGG